MHKKNKTLKTKGNIMAIAGLFMIFINALTFLIRDNNQFIVGTIGLLFLIIGINISKNSKPALKKKTNLLLISVAIIIVLVIITFTSNNKSNDNDQMPNITEQEALRIAEERIMSDYNFNNLNGYDLTLMATPEKCGDNCFSLKYEYKVNQTIISDVDKIQISLIVEGPRTKNMSYSEITVSEKRISSITDFTSCVKAGNEALYPDCEGCVPYCETPDGRVFSDALDSKTPAKLNIE
jgi:hypothetical protein